MAKENFNRNKPHLNIGTIGQLQKYYLMQVTVKQNHLIKLIMLQKKKKEVLQLIHLTLSMKLLIVTMHTLTVLVTRIT